MADTVHGAVVEKVVAFPSDTLLDLLSQIQLRNGIINWIEFKDRKQQAFREEVRVVIYRFIRRAIYAVENQEDFQKSIDLSRDGAFYITFASELLRSIQYSVGRLKSNEEDDILRLLHQELIQVCRRHVLRGMVSHEFTYVGSSTTGKFIIAPAV